MKLDIDCITLLPDFGKVASEDSIPLYRVGALHCNPEGHALAAKLVAAELIKRGLLPPPAEPALSRHG